MFPKTLAKFAQLGVGGWRGSAARMELGTLGTFDKTPTSDSTDDGLLRNVKIVSVFFLVRLWVRGKVAFPVLEAYRKRCLFQRTSTV